MDEKTFDIYKKGITCTINQADSDYATSLVKRYKPKNIEEMSAFVAIIRPGCASLLQDFIDRKDYSTDVEELDNLLIEGNHRMIYQELIMKYLIWLDVPESSSYDIIKKIAKKKFKSNELKELKDKLLKSWIDKVGTKNGFDETWAVVQDAAKYSFNASHSLSYAYDSLYGAYLKSHYPLEYYTVALNYYKNDMERTSKLTNELSNFDIKIKPIKFRYSKDDYTLSYDDKSIYKGISSIKYMNNTIANELYELKNNNYNSFIELLYDLKNTSITIRQLKALTELGFFDEFGDSNYLLYLINLHREIGDKIQIKKEKIKQMGIDINLFKKFAEKETEKTFMKIDAKKILIEISKNISIKKQSLKEKIESQKEYLEYLDIKDDRYKGLAYIDDINTKYAPKLIVYSLKNGTYNQCKIDKKTYNKNKIKNGDIIKVISTTLKPKLRKNENGIFEQIPETFEMWITKYEKINI